MAANFTEDFLSPAFFTFALGFGSALGAVSTKPLFCPFFLAIKAYRGWEKNTLATQQSGWTYKIIQVRTYVHLHRINCGWSNGHEFASICNVWQRERAPLPLLDTQMFSSTCLLVTLLLIVIQMTRRTTHNPPVLACHDARLVRLKRLRYIEIFTIFKGPQDIAC